MIEKLYLLVLMLRYHSREAYRVWKKEIWSKNLGDLYCCTALDLYGQQNCGCHAVTVREWFGYLREKEKR